MELAIGHFSHLPDSVVMASYGYDRPLLAATDAASEDLGKIVLEMLVLQLVASLPAHASKVWLYEPRASHQFAELKRLQAVTHNDIGQQWLSARDAIRALHGFDELLLSRASLLASSGCASLAAYNATRRTPEPTIFVVIAHPAALVAQDVQVLHTLSHLAERGPSCGIVPVLLHDLKFSRSLALLPQQSKAMYAALEKIAHKALGFDFTQEAVPYGIGQPYQHFITDFGYAPQFKEGAAKALGERILVARDHAVAKNPHKDFLRIKIGEARAKPVHFAMGHASHVYHAMVSGGSGSGKTTFIQNLLLGMCETYTPDDLQLILLDCGTVSFGPYRKVSHVLGVFDDPTDGVGLGRVFDYLVQELHRRKEAFKKCGKERDVTVDNLQTYRRLTSVVLPPILLVIDEFGSLMADENREVMALVDGRAVPIRVHAAQVINLLAREGRKVGLHVVLITQTFAKVRHMPEDFKSNPHVAVALKAEEPSDSRAILSRENDVAHNIQLFQAVLNLKGGQLNANIIVDLDYITEDEIERRQRAVRDQWPKSSPSALEAFIEKGAPSVVEASIGGARPAAAPGWLRG